MPYTQKKYTHTHSHIKPTIQTKHALHLFARDCVSLATTTPIHTFRMHMVRSLGNTTKRNHNRVSQLSVVSMYLKYRRVIIYIICISVHHHMYLHRISVDITVSIGMVVCPAVLILLPICTRSVACDLCSEIVVVQLVRASLRSVVCLCLCFYWMLKRILLNT